MLETMGPSWYREEPAPIIAGYQCPLPQTLRLDPREIASTAAPDDFFFFPPKEMRSLPTLVLQFIVLRVFIAMAVGHLSTVQRLPMKDRTLRVAVSVVFPLTPLVDLFWQLVVVFVATWHAQWPAGQRWLQLKALFASIFGQRATARGDDSEDGVELRAVPLDHLKCVSQPRDRTYWFREIIQLIGLGQSVATVVLWVRRLQKTPQDMLHDYDPCYGSGFMLQDGHRPVCAYGNEIHKRNDLVLVKIRMSRHVASFDTWNGICAVGVATACLSTFILLACSTDWRYQSSNGSNVSDEAGIPLTDFTFPGQRGEASRHPSGDAEQAQEHGAAQTASMPAWKYSRSIFISLALQCTIGYNWFSDYISLYQAARSGAFGGAFLQFGAGEITSINDEYTVAFYNMSSILGLLVLVSLALLVPSWRMKVVPWTTLMFAIVVGFLLPFMLTVFDFMDMWRDNYSWPLFLWKDPVSKTLWSFVG